MGGHREKDKQDESKFLPTINKDGDVGYCRSTDRVLAPSGHLYMFCDDEVSSILLNWIREDKDMAYEGATC